MIGWVTWPLSVFSQDRAQVWPKGQGPEKTDQWQGVQVIVLIKLWEEEFSQMKHPHFVGGVGGEVGQALVPKRQEATFHGNYMPRKLGHACTVGT